MAPTITPKRNTRATSQMQPPINLSDIEQLINNAKEEILSNFRNEVSKINTSLTHLSAKIEKIDNRIIELEDKTSNQQMQIENILADLKNIQKDEGMDIFGEMESRMHRMNNVIISGIPEMSSGTVNDRIIHDVEAVDKVCQEVGVKNTRNFKVLRVGKPHPDKPRLLKVTCPDTVMKQQILRNSKALRTVKAYKNVFINEDQTPIQQKQSKALRSELKERRDRGEDIVIYRNQIVQRSEVKNFQQKF